MLVPNPAHMESSMLLRTSARPGSMASFVGVSCLGLVLSALGVTHPGPLSLLRSCACLSLAVSALQFAHLGSFTLPQCSAHLEPAVLACGLS